MVQIYMFLMKNDLVMSLFFFLHLINLILMINIMWLICYVHIIRYGTLGWLTLSLTLLVPTKFTIHNFLTRLQKTRGFGNQRLMGLIQLQVLINYVLISLFILLTWCDLDLGTSFGKFKHHQRLKIWYGEFVEIAFQLDNHFKVKILLVLVIVFYVIMVSKILCMFF